MIENRKRALVIAISEYESDELSDLSFCKNDGEEIGALLKEIGYDVKKQLVGNVNGTDLQDEIIDFFQDPEIKHDDTVLFYYSGHGIPGAAGEVYLSASNIDPTKPMKRGFSFDELTTMMESCKSKCLVTMLDCCYSGSAKISKSDEKARVKLVQNYQIEKINNLKQGEGKCLLSASLGFQESFGTMEGKHSFFTHYLLKGLGGANGESVDKNGVVTPESLMQYIDSEIDKLPIGKRPSQTPLRKIETVGRIVLAEYPKYAKNKDDPILDFLKHGPPSLRYPLAVGLIRTKDLRKEKRSTGFLIGPNLIITDSKMFPSKDSAENAEVIFDKKIVDSSMEIKDRKSSLYSVYDRYNLAPSDIFITSDTGFTIIATENTPGIKYGWIDIQQKIDFFANRQNKEIFITYFPERPIEIVQGPEEYPDRITDLVDNKIERLGDGKIFFKSNYHTKMTAGAPMFTHNWELIGMYRKTDEPMPVGMISAPRETKFFITREGILAETIFDEIKRLSEEGSVDINRMIGAQM